MTIWVDASAGASGDMLLGALVDAGVPLDVLQTAVDAVAPEPVSLSPVTVQRNGFAAVLCGVRIEDSAEHRSWRDIRALLQSADLSEDVRGLAIRVFERLAVAEATVHGSDPLDVSFHEVGALDAIADVVGVCAGFRYLLGWFRDGCERSTSDLLDDRSGRLAGRGRVWLGPGRPRPDAGAAAGGRGTAAGRPVVRRSSGLTGDGALYADRCGTAHDPGDLLGSAAGDDRRADRRGCGHPRPGGVRRTSCGFWSRQARPTKPLDQRTQLDRRA